MLNRRILRIKVMQALYAFFQGEEDSVAVTENQLFRSFDRLYDLYILQLILLTEIYHEAQRHIEESGINSSRQMKIVWKITTSPLIAFCKL